MFPRFQRSDRQTLMTIMSRGNHDQINLLVREEILGLAVHVGLREIFLGGRPWLTVYGGFGVTLKKGVDGEIWR
jgi:hypothetical protein